MLAGKRLIVLLKGEHSLQVNKHLMGKQNRSVSGRVTIQETLTFWTTELSWSDHQCGWMCCWPRNSAGSIFWILKLWFCRRLHKKRSQTCGPVCKLTLYQELRPVKTWLHYLGAALKISLCKLLRKKKKRQKFSDFINCIIRVSLIITKNAQPIPKTTVCHIWLEPDNAAPWVVWWACF